MNIAIEYMLRGKKIQDFLQLPCSLFLEPLRIIDINGHATGATKQIVTLSHGYGHDLIIIRQYKIEESSKTDMLPPFRENVTRLSQVFDDPCVIIENYKLLEFTEEPYETPEKHYSDMPHSALQEKEYKECMEKFFNPRCLRKIRENWLWTLFEKAYVPSEVRQKYTSPQSDVQKEYVVHYCKNIWRTWEYWKKHLLDFDGPAAELIFAKVYNSAFLKLELKEYKESPYDRRYIINDEFPIMVDRHVVGWGRS